MYSNYSKSGQIICMIQLNLFKVIAYSFMILHTIHITRQNVKGDLNIVLIHCTTELYHFSLNGIIIASKLFCYLRSCTYFNQIKQRFYLHVFIYTCKHIFLQFVCTSFSRSIVFVRGLWILVIKFHNFCKHVFTKLKRQYECSFLMHKQHFNVLNHYFFYIPQNFWQKWELPNNLFVLNTLPKQICASGDSISGSVLRMFCAVKNVIK